MGVPAPPSRESEEAVTWEAQRGLAHSECWVSISWYHYPRRGRGAGGLAQTVSFSPEGSQSPPSSGFCTVPALGSPVNRGLAGSCHKDAHLPKGHDVQDGLEQADGPPLLNPSALEPLVSGAWDKQSQLSYRARPSWHIFPARP